MSSRRAGITSLVVAFATLIACDPRVTTIGVAGTHPEAGVAINGPDAHVDAQVGASVDAQVGASVDAQVDVRVDAQVDARADVGRYVEAEDGVLTAGFIIGEDATASAGRFIHAETGVSAEDAPGDARATYELLATESGSYLIWGRIHGQDIDTNRFWVKVDDEAWFKWRITTGDIWYWDAFHDNIDYGNAIHFELAAGTHLLVIANSVDGAGLDRLYYAPAPSHPAGDDTPCNPPHSIQVNGVCDPSCGSRGGQCGGPACTDLPSFPTYDCPACCLPDQ